MSATSWIGRMPTDAATSAVAATGLRHKVWIQDPTAPLFVMVHGRAGNRDVMWAFTYSIPPTVNLLFPEAFLDDPNDGGHSWWLKHGTSAEAIQQAVERLSHFIQASIQQYQISPSGIVGVGFSQGAGILSALMQDQPQLLAGFASLAGFIIERPAKTAAPETQVFMAHGSKDAIVPIDMARRGADFLTQRGHTVEFHADEVEHKVGKTGMRELKAWTRKLVASF